MQTKDDSNFDKGPEATSPVGPRKLTPPASSYPAVGDWRSILEIPEVERLTPKRFWDTPYPLIVSVTLFFAALKVPYRSINIPQEIMIPCAVVSLIVILVLAFENFHMVTLLLVAYLPFSRILPGGFGGFMTAFNLTNILLIVVVVGMLVKSAIRREAMYSRCPLDIPMIVFCVFASISLMRGMMDPSQHYTFSESLTELKRWLTPFFFYFVFANMVRKREEVVNTMVIICVVLVIVGLMGLKEFYMDKGYSGTFDKMRIEGITEQPNNLSAFFSFYSFFLVAFGYYFWERRSAKIALLGFFACFRAMNFTFSRGGTISFFLVGFATLFFLGRKWLVVAIICFLPFFLFPEQCPMPSSVMGRLPLTVFGTTSNPELELSARQRIQVWNAGIRMTKDNAILGVGYELFPYKVQAYAQPGENLIRMDAHNTYVLIAAEMGVPALVLFLALFGIMIYYAFWLYRITQDRFYKAFSFGMILSYLGVLSANMFGSRLFAQELTSYLWITSGLLMTVCRAEKARLAEEAERTERAEDAPASTTA